MREILFRGFHECENGTQIAVVNGVEHNGEWLEGDLVHRCGIYVFPEYGFNSYDCYKVIPETVGQFTGQKDKNGRRIFEGDFVRYGVDACLVVFENRCGNAHFGIVMGEFETWNFGFSVPADRMEVIGTVFDKEVENG